jgi:isochorismate synthase
MTLELAELAREHASSARERARERDRPVLLSLSLPIAAPEDPLVLIESAPENDGYAFLWQRPTDGFALAAIGALTISAAQGPLRFKTVAAACDRILEDSITAVCGNADRPGPFFVGGFAFSPTIVSPSEWEAFPAGCMILPRSHVVRCGSSATLTVNTMVEANTSPGDVVEELCVELARLNGTKPPFSPPLARGDKEGGPTLPRGNKEGSPRLPSADREADLRSPRQEREEGHANTREESPIVQETTVTPDAREWRRAVVQTIADIRAGRLDKLVLARECRVSCRGNVDPRRLLRRLRFAYPTCTNFLIRVPDAVFVGATPERLVALNRGEVRTAALAGSIARSPSKTKDRELGYKLLRDSKERREHALVVRAIEEALTPLCSRLDVAGEPDLLQLENVQHLVTPISGQLFRSCGILDLVARLHPSPAVGGYPRATALEALREREDIERGWYAGPVGWMDARGNGDFAVAVRSALVRDSAVTLCAGAGIVAGSDPDAELAEVHLKMQPLLSALAEEGTTKATQMSNQRLAS